MTLSDLAPGSRVFVDANVFIYHFAGRSPDCRALLEAVGEGSIEAVTGPIVLLEVAHRLTALEAAASGFARGRNPAAALAANPDLVRRLSRYYFDAARIPDMGVEILPLPEDVLTASQEFRQSHGLLVNDSVILAQMRRAGVTVLASADAGFDRVPWVRRVGPADV
ncbi:MAG: PIN domain-containing protein [Acidobacteria bacterium]|nr:PIN domain-containing protein [Acidobacteriota bacterium]